MKFAQVVCVFVRSDGRRSESSARAHLLNDLHASNEADFVGALCEQASSWLNEGGPIYSGELLCAPCYLFVVRPARLGFTQSARRFAGGIINSGALLSVLVLVHGEAADKLATATKETRVLTVKGARDGSNRSLRGEFGLMTLLGAGARRADARSSSPETNLRLFMMVIRRSAVAYANVNHDQDQEDHRHLIELEAGKTAELSCHLFGGGGGVDSHANSAPPPSSESSHEETESVVDNLLASLDDGNDPSSSSSSTSYLAHKKLDWPTRSELDRRNSDDDHVRLVSLVFWYKDDNPSPIYTLDARRHQVPAASDSISRDSLPPPLDGESKGHNSSSLLVAGLLARARHYSADESRYKLADSSSGELKLLIANTSATDSGKYKCRVDFRRWPTQSQLMELSVRGEFLFKLL